MFQVLLLLASLSLSSSLHCLSCKIEWDQEGYRSYYDLNGERIKDCPLLECTDLLPGLACAKAEYTITTSQWEWRNCSSTFSSECKDVLEMDKDVCSVSLHCTADGCNGYSDHPTDAPPPARPFPTTHTLEPEALGMPVILGAAAGGVIVLIVIIIVVVVLIRMGRRRRGDGYEKADKGADEKEDNFKKYKDACTKEGGEEKSSRKSIKNFYKKSSKNEVKV